ncbi:2-dehydro-3-deoxygalactonokinase [Arsenicitalea aurantiaca]|uniref:2-dehydro-3-deoxygalactonokinase n=1 Tax=Arsenicitalea aurantiaca TaxID=1783274 RepID=UPI001315763E|nr:2-dehydro-3-deoxygalactonokinase [Arsenicitalea aurantiaca]
MVELAAWIAVDWGTSNLRAWGMSDTGDPLFERVSDKGMAKLAPDAFGPVLSELLGDAVPEGRTLKTLICGMAGARQGWLEAPYLDAPADLSALGRAAVMPEIADSRFAPRILPGVCQRGLGQEDVMRGEETQLLGLSTLQPGYSGVVVLPGTHSKWAVLEGHQLVRFSTAMTGEIYEALGSHTVLRHSLKDAGIGPERDEGVDAGIAAGLEAPERLAGMIFKVRAAALLSGRSADWCAGYLSGLLIGAEIGAHRHWIGSAPIPIIGGSTLSALYARALGMTGAECVPVDVRTATLAGLSAAAQH